MTETSPQKVEIVHVSSQLSPDIRTALSESISGLEGRTQTRVYRDLRYAVFSPHNFQLFVAKAGERIVGHLSARIVGEIGWLASAQISDEYQSKGIFNRLRQVAEDWLVGNDVHNVRVSIASDSLKLRNIFERKGYSPISLAIEPNKYLDERKGKRARDNFSRVLTSDSFETFRNKLGLLSGNFMVDAMYVPATPEIWSELVQQERIYTDLNNSIFIVLSPVYAPKTFQGFIIADDSEGYRLGAEALEEFAMQTSALEVIAHAPSSRESVTGLTSAGYSWMHPYSVIVYQKEI